MVNIQSATTEIKRGKKRKKQDKHIMSASATQGGHNKEAEPTWSMHLWSCVSRQARPVSSRLVRANSCRTRGYSCQLFIREPLLHHTSYNDDHQLSTHKHCK